jgi:hypothetical protein
MSEPAPGLPAGTLVSAVNNARRGVVTHITIHGERVAAIVPESVIEAFRIFAAIVTSNESTLPLGVLQAIFRWARSLPPDQLQQFAAELTAATASSTRELTAAAAGGRVKLPDLMGRVINAWKATAEAYADPARTEALRAPAEDSGPVPDPSRG